MDDKLRNKLLKIAIGGLTLSAVLFICLAIFTEENNNAYLWSALGNIVLANLVNIIRNQTTK